MTSLTDSCSFIRINSSLSNLSTRSNSFKNSCEESDGDQNSHRKKSCSFVEDSHSDFEPNNESSVELNHSKHAISIATQDSTGIAIAAGTIAIVALVVILLPSQCSLPPDIAKYMYITGSSILGAEAIGLGALFLKFKSENHKSLIKPQIKPAHSESDPTHSESDPAHTESYLVRLLQQHARRGY